MCWQHELAGIATLQAVQQHQAMRVLSPTQLQTEKQKGRPVAGRRTVHAQHGSDCMLPKYTHMINNSHTCSRYAFTAGKLAECSM